MTCRLIVRYNDVIAEGGKPLNIQKEADSSMKKLFALLIAAMLLCGAAAAETVDAYTTASATKTVLSGEALAAAEEVLMAKSSLLSSADEAKAEGYQAKTGTGIAQIMSINVDGSIGLSSISDWKYENGKVFVRLTQGQNALNLAKEGATGTLLVKGDSGYYIVHLKTVAVTVLEYSAETAGQFDQYYSGAANALNEYDIEFDVGAIEQTSMLMF